MTNLEKKAILASAIFRNTDPSIVNELLNDPEITVKKTPKSGMIYSENDFERMLGIIISGAARVEKTKNGKSVIMSTLEKSSVFGMAALFYEEDSYPTVITAVRNTTAAFFTKQWLTKAFAAEPQIAENYISLISAKLHFLNKKIETLISRGCGGKLYSYLLQEYDANGCDGKLELKYNMAQLSKVLGIGRTTLYRELQELTDNNIIKKDGSMIEFIAQQP